jgi:hypothetical protein
MVADISPADSRTADNFVVDNLVVEVAGSFPAAGSRQVDTPARAPYLARRL